MIAALRLGRSPTAISFETLQIMPIRTLRRRTAALGAALAALPAIAHAQTSTDGGQPYRFTVEGYLAQYWLDNGVADKQGLGGFGGRLMFNRSTPARAVRTLADRATVGVFATYTTGQGDPEVSTLHAGAEVDASLFGAPIASGFLDPFVSIGAGFYRVSADLPATTGSNDRRVRTDFALTPAAGTRVPFFNGIGARGDLRLPIIFGNTTSVNFVAEGGLYVSF
jgi:hypothetical protein